MLVEAPRHPPITAQLLHTHDLVNLLGNVQLRIDMNFVAGIHLRPVFRDGEGRCRQLESGLYWKSISIEIARYSNLVAHRGICARRAGMAMLHHDWLQPRLPSLLTALREILMMLTSDQRNECIAQVLDVSLIMQEIHNGAVDIGSLAASIGSIMKQEQNLLCGESMDIMIAKLRRVSLSCEADGIVEGLKMMFDLLEQLKLVRRLAPIPSQVLIMFKPETRRSSDSGSP